jgi:excisionase family DNA binding protein
MIHEVERENGHRFLTVDEVAALLREKREWVYVNYKRYPMGAVRLNHKRLLFKREEFEQWLAGLAE